MDDVVPEADKAGDASVRQTLLRADFFRSCLAQSRLLCKVQLLFSSVSVAWLCLLPGKQLSTHMRSGAAKLDASAVAAPAASLAVASRCPAYSARCIMTVAGHRLLACGCFMPGLHAAAQNHHAETHLSDAPSSAAAQWSLLAACSQEAAAVQDRAQVMLLKNLDLDGAQQLVNGSRGVITSFVDKKVLHTC